jgi:hypothetical protein
MTKKWNHHKNRNLGSVSVKNDLFFSPTLGVPAHAYSSRQCTNCPASFPYAPCNKKNGSDPHCPSLARAIRVAA